MRGGREDADSVYNKSIIVACMKWKSAQDTVSLVARYSPPSPAIRFSSCSGVNKVK